MSFFTHGFALTLNDRRLKKAAKRDSTTGTGSDSSSTHRKTEGEEGRRTQGRWDVLTDAYGRTYWQHSLTGEWSYGYGGGFVPPVGIVNPSPMGFSGVVFTPSPMFALPSPPVMEKGDKKKEKEQKKEKDQDQDQERKKEKGWWEAMYDKDGVRYWQHTVTKKTSYKDPYY